MIPFPGGQPATIVAASAIRWSLFQGGPNLARGPKRTSSARSRQLAGRSGLHVLGVVEVDLPAAGPCLFGEHLAVHDRVGVALVRRAPLDGDVRGKVERPGSE